MKFLHGLLFGLCLSFILAYTLVGFFDRRTNRIIIRTIQEITAPPTLEEVQNAAQ